MVKIVIYLWQFFLYRKNYYKFTTIFTVNSALLLQSDIVICVTIFFSVQLMILYLNLYPQKKKEWCINLLKEITYSPAILNKNTSLPPSANWLYVYTLPPTPISMR